MKIREELFNRQQTKEKKRTSSQIKTRDHLKVQFDVKSREAQKLSKSRAGPALEIDSKFLTSDDESIGSNKPAERVQVQSQNIFKKLKHTHQPSLESGHEDSLFKIGS